jgi:hypothetical protein
MSSYTEDFKDEPKSFHLDNITVEKITGTVENFYVHSSYVYSFDNYEHSPPSNTFVSNEVLTYNTVARNKAGKIRGYKIFGPEYTCRDYKYLLYSPNTYEGEDIIPCMSGFHYCLQAIDCLKY